MTRRQQIDDALLARIAALPPGGQRWLKTVLHLIRSDDALLEEPEAREETRRRGPQRKAREKAAGLEDVITGKADLKEQLEAYPELAEELDGLADIIDMLREAGERRRRRGEQILREEILGESSDEEEE
jgi:hypothetical protein